MRVEIAPVLFKPYPAGMRTGNLFNEREKRILISRIITLGPDQGPMWGRMSLADMLDHCALALESALMSGTRDMCLQPCPELEYASRLWRCGIHSFKADEIEKKMMRLINFIKHFDREHMSKDAHPFLGDMIYKEFGEIHFLHLNHHLVQFGR